MRSVGVFIFSLLALHAHSQPLESFVNFVGACDASAAVALDPELVVVADDETNLLRVYSRFAGGPPVRTLDLSRFLLAHSKGPEADIEAGARIGDRIYWITSHGQNASGKTRINRRQFFATSMTTFADGVGLKPLGLPYRNLLRDLLSDPQLKPFDLQRASSRPPKTPGALNIEGLAATPEGHLLIGFRNPVPRGRALVVRLLNPSELLGGSRARFGAPQLLDLDGMGIRSLERVGELYLIIAGSTRAGGRSRLFRWEGGLDKPREFRDLDFGTLNPEAMALCPVPGERPVLFITSDDGVAPVAGSSCKDAKDPSLKSFRGLSLQLPLPPAQ